MGDEERPLVVRVGEAHFAVQVVGLVLPVAAALQPDLRRQIRALGAEAERGEGLPGAVSRTTAELGLVDLG